MSWDMSDITINQHGGAAGAYINSTLTIKQDTTITQMPYRLAVVMIKTRSAWKWKYYCGSVPFKGK
jgi:hypothetical protein